MDWGSVISGSSLVWSGLSWTILNMSSVSMLPHKTADDSVIDVQADTNIPTEHPCPMHPNYLPSDIFRYSLPWPYPTFYRLTKARSLLLPYCIFRIYTLSIFSSSHDLGETDVLHETLCEYRDVRVQFNGTVHGGLCSVIFIINESFMLCLINDHVYSKSIVYSAIINAYYLNKLTFSLTPPGLL